MDAQPLISHLHSSRAGGRGLPARWDQSAAPDLPLGAVQKKQGRQGARGQLEGRIAFERVRRRQEKRRSGECDPA
jgi:hypothetical protein